MTAQPDVRTEALINEVVLYLAAVDAFRRLGHEPHWQPEPGSTRRRPRRDRRQIPQPLL